MDYGGNVGKLDFGIIQGDNLCYASWQSNTNHYSDRCYTSDIL